MSVWAALRLVVLVGTAFFLFAACDAAVDRTVSDDEFIESMRQSDAIFGELFDIGIDEFGSPDRQSREGYYCAGIGGATGADRLELLASWDLEEIELERVRPAVDQVEALFESRNEIVIDSDPADIAGIGVVGISDAMHFSVKGPADASELFQRFSVSVTSRCGDPDLIESVDP